MRPADCASPGHLVRSGLVMRVLNSGQMREADRRTIDGGVASLDLMERAGREVAAAMASGFPDLAARRVAVLCGKGNNGGDGFVVARLLRERGVPVRVWLVGRAADVRNDARTNLDRLRALGVEVAEIDDDGALDAVPPAGSRIRSDRGRAVRDRALDAARRPAGNGRRRRECVGQARGVDRSPERPLGRPARTDRTRDSSDADRDARRAETAAGAAASRRADGNARHRGHRHPARDDRRDRRPERHPPHARTRCART